VESEGLAQISDDSEIDAMIDAAIESEPEAADQVRSGNEKAIGRIVGAAMKNSQGRIDGGLAREKILERLG
jgi:aspartyl-tRNA(Asn)/glutamyl-tRNA(Gln) amidotransferase subunit B